MATARKVLRRNKVRSRIRKKITGTAEMPRLSVYRSNKQIYAQVIDDINGKTLASAGSIAEKDGDKGSKSDQAKIVGQRIAERAIANGISQVVFDRGGYLYHGRVKALAEAAREGGLKL
jgi:large subunit ribosomal protein L18